MEIRRQLDKWHANIKSWLLDFSGRLHLLRLEDFQNDKKGVLMRLFKFLDVPYSMARLKCIVSVLTPEHFSKCHEALGDDLFSSEIHDLKVQYQKNIELYFALRLKRGYDFSY